MAGKLSDEDALMAKAVGQVKMIIEYSLSTTAKAIIESGEDKKIDCGLSYLLIAAVYSTLLDGMVALFEASGMTRADAIAKAAQLMLAPGDAIDNAASQVRESGSKENESFKWN